MGIGILLTIRVKFIRIANVVNGLIAITSLYIALVAGIKLYFKYLE